MLACCRLRGWAMGWVPLARPKLAWSESRLAEGSARRPPPSLPNPGAAKCQSEFLETANPMRMPRSGVDVVAPTPARTRRRSNAGLRERQASSIKTEFGQQRPRRVRHRARVAGEQRHQEHQVLAQANLDGDASDASTTSRRMRQGVSSRCQEVIVA